MAFHVWVEIGLLALANVALAVIVWLLARVDRLREDRDWWRAQWRQAFERPRAKAKAEEDRHR